MIERIINLILSYYSQRVIVLERKLGILIELSMSKRSLSVLNINGEVDNFYLNLKKHYKSFISNAKSMLQNDLIIPVVYGLDAEVNGDVIVIGHLNGGFGTIRDKAIHARKEVYDNNIDIIVDAIMKNHNVYFVVPNYVGDYIINFFSLFISRGWFTKKQYKSQVKIIRYDVNNEAEALNKIDNECKGMKFVIQNPPYDGTLHLQFLQKGLKLMKEDGKMTIIEPATWLINLNLNSTYVKGRKDNPTPQIKKDIDGHVQKVMIDNLNKPFGTRLYMPFSIVTIDKSKKFDTIEFICCGEKQEVKSLYDCNLIGDHKLVQSILTKAQQFGDVMENHITKENMGEGFWYIKYAELDGLDLCQLETERSGRNYDTSLNIFMQHKDGEFLTKYSTGAYHYNMNSISDKPHFGLDSGNHSTGKITTNIYGTKEELENWKHYIFNNKLPLFLNIVLTIDQNNNSTKYLPWLVDKQYTDEEIYELLGLTEDEIKLIDRTIKKYERNSPWFKRYMCGPDSVSDEEVNNFCKGLDE